MSVTPNIDLQLPPIGSNNWGGPLNYNFAALDAFLSGNQAIPGLLVDGDVTVTGKITAGSFSGLDGAYFLTSALFDVANGIPQLDGTGKIPADLLPASGIDVISFTPTPVFDGSVSSAFKITLTGNVTSSSFVNGEEAAAIVVFRIVQDATGGRTFVWPGNVRNAGAVNPGANIRSVQAFALDTDGSLDALAPMLYS